MKVWRIAHESATFDSFPSGPYASPETLPAYVGDSLTPMFSAHCDRAHPTPYSDRSLRGIDGLERCGFDSREALYEWFDGFTEVLDECGFRLFAYDVDDEHARLGAMGQIVFSRYHARELSRESLHSKPVQLELF